jgi:hypothetical protein
MKILNLVKEMELVFLDLMLKIVQKFQFLHGDIIYYQLDQKVRTLSLNGLIFRLKLIMNLLIILEIYSIEF